MINSILKLSTKYNFSVLDLRPFFSDEELSSGLLRDSHHTNPSGAIKYAEIINEFLFEGRFLAPKIEHDSKNSYAFTKSKSIQKSAFKSFNVQIEGEIVGIFHNIGPFSNYIKIETEKAFSREINLFDRWCFYKRSAFIDFSGMPIDGGNVTFTVCNRSFDRQICGKNIDFESFKPMFAVGDICYIGNITKIIIDDEELEH